MDFIIRINILNGAYRIMLFAQSLIAVVSFGELLVFFFYKFYSEKNTIYTQRHDENMRYSNLKTRVWRGQKPSFPLDIYIFYSVQFVFVNRLEDLRASFFSDDPPGGLPGIVRVGRGEQSVCRRIVYRLRFSLFVDSFSIQVGVQSKIRNIRVGNWRWSIEFYFERVVFY